MSNISVVSLINEYERRQHIDSLFDAHNLDFSYFDAINKFQIDDTLKKYDLTINTDRMSLGEVACYLSHYCLWQQVIEYNLPYLMVFEDDIYFSKSAKTILNNLDWLPDSFDVIKLETMYDRVMINRGTSLLLGHKLCQMQSRHMGMAGYIISQKGVRKLLAMTKMLGVDRQVDHIMFDRLILEKGSSVHQVFPALCIQDKIYNKDSIQFQSELENERSSLQVIEEKVFGLKKVNKEFTRVFKQLLPKNMYYKGWLFVKGYKKQKITYFE